MMVGLLSTKVEFSLHIALHWRVSTAGDWTACFKNFRSLFDNLNLLSIYSSDGACRYIAAALIEIEDTLRQNAVVTCTSEKCLWKRRKRTHNEASNLEDMTFTEPEIGKIKRMTRTKAAVKNKNLVEQFRGLLIRTVPSAVGLHLLPDTGLNKATGATEE